MNTDASAMSEEQTNEYCNASYDYQQTEMEDSSCVCCDNCVGNADESRVMPDNDAQLYWNEFDAMAQFPSSYTDYNECNCLSSAITPPNSHVDPQSDYSWPGSDIQSQPSNYKPQPARTYGYPMLEQQQQQQQQRPTILVIVVNKPLSNVSVGYPKPMAGFQKEYLTLGCQNCCCHAPAGFKEEGFNNDVSGGIAALRLHNLGKNQTNEVVYDSGQNQISVQRVKANESKLPKGSDRGRDRKQTGCNCIPDNLNDDASTIRTTQSETTTNKECTCEDSLGITPDDGECLCYLTELCKKKKKLKKRKPRYDRFASSPFVINPKPNCCSHCCCNRSCCYPCCSPCCNPCYPWC